MPRSLSSRCHRAASGNLFTTSAPWWSCTLQMPIAFHWRSLQRHQLLQPCSKQGTLPLPRRRAEKWKKWLAGPSKPEPKEEKVRVSTLLRLAAGLSLWSLGSIDPGGNGHTLHTSSFQSAPNQSLVECCWEKHMQFYFTSGWHSYGKGGIWRGGWSNLTRNAWDRSACAFVAMNIVCFDLIQLYMFNLRQNDIFWSWK